MPKDKGGIRRQMNWKQKVDKVRTLRTPTFQGGHSQLATTPVDTPTVAWRELLLKAQRISAVRSPCLSRLGVPSAFSFAHGAALSTAHTNLSTAHGGRKNVSVRNRVFKIDSKMAPQVPMADKCHALFKLPCSWKKWMFWAKYVGENHQSWNSFTIMSFLEITSSLIGHVCSRFWCATKTKRPEPPAKK